ncbi:hypothetical protein CROQUDRAFT_98878 [Cronartium quercuum f. sp. fusiforme G11]|uniref:Uncharacterized protein n=1 Tax=Cronartium quercuum f. sp. fusiforme G11 TaxID=708437 RepID=A0A9P6T6T6_9BASI|nr:hypothetical protein CROQUDRAFT_98878 [Cronartium quercuum f. sp. fusiforme G11]
MAFHLAALGEFIAILGGLGLGSQKVGLVEGSGYSQGVASESSTFTPSLCGSIPRKKHSQALSSSLCPSVAGT